MKIYLVGGAVRDGLLKKKITERDWVVIGETPQSMLAAGYHQVGKDFPVFLHPTTKEEYALARKERKIAQGYHGFEFDTTTSVTLAEDLLRRDLTINAIAQDNQGNIIDPYHGIDDLNHKVLRHVSKAFIEDPVRILRVARFAARFPDFHVAEETNELMKNMVTQGEVNALVAERIWKEFEKAISEIAPWRFIEALDDCCALETIFPIFKQYKTRIIFCLTQLDALTKHTSEKIILLLKSIESIDEIKKLCAHYRAPKQISEMVNLLLQFEFAYFSIFNYTPKEILTLLQSLDAFRRPERFNQWIRLCQLSQKLKNPDQDVYPEAEYLLNAFQCVEKIELSDAFLSQNRGKAIGEYIEKQRLTKLERFQKITS